MILKYLNQHFTSLLRSRNQSLHGLGSSSTLTYQDLNKAISGFNSAITFDDAKVFSCPCCGPSPKYIVADGKSDGPVKRKVCYTCMYIPGVPQKSLPVFGDFLLKYEHHKL